MEKLASIKDKFPQWYLDVIEAADLAENSPTPGCIVIKPYGYAIWENIQSSLDKQIKELGAQNIYLPLLIPESFIKKEAKHVEGFSPELAVVTHAGGKQLEEPLVIRPTSETMVYYMFSKWIKSWRDLPFKINQWANIVRWEMRPRPFLRSREFLWQEGHTAHCSYEEANEFALKVRNLYEKFLEEYLAIPVIVGEKTKNERFAGADHTYTLEAMMQDGKALQIGTTHVLAQSFSKAFEIQYQDKNGKIQNPYCTSWGVTTRMIGALIMVHGDDKGLIIPPRIAPIQVIIITIYSRPVCRTDEQKEIILKKANDLKTQLINKGIRAKIDCDETKTPGAKFYHWEVRGVPVRIEIGPKDIEKKQVAIASRLGKKEFVSQDNIAEKVKTLLDGIQKKLLELTKSRMRDNCHESNTESGFYQAGWCGNDECEDALKKHKSSIRCLLETSKYKVCFQCKKDSIKDVIIAKAY